MRKAAVILILVVLSLSFSVAMAADGVVYNDEELGFSFEMPADYEFYGDVSSETVDVTETERITKLPMYLGYDSNISVVYIDGKEDFDTFEKALPDGVTREEIDFYLMSDKDKDETGEHFIDNFKAPDIDILDSEWLDYGGKLCLYATTKGYNSELGLDFYQGSLNFMYMDYYIAIAYTKFDIDGTLIIDDAKAEFEESFDTIKFNAVPSNKEAKIKSGINIDWSEAGIKGIYGGVGGAIIGGVIVIINKRKAKRRKREVDYENRTEG